MRLIDADALCAKLQAEIGSPEGHKKLMLINYLITSAPTIEAEPVRRGRWINHGSFVTCSVCNEEQYGIDTGRFYCQNCGAKMEAENETN